MEMPAVEMPTYELSDFERHYENTRSSWEQTTHTIETFLIGDTTKEVACEAIRDHIETALRPFIYIAINTADGQLLYNGYGTYLSLMNLHEDTFRNIAERRGLDMSSFPLFKTFAAVRAKGFIDKVDEYSNIHTAQETIEYTEIGIFKDVRLSLRDNMAALSVSHAKHKRERFKRVCQKAGTIGKIIANSLTGAHSPVRPIIPGNLRHS